MKYRNIIRIGSSYYVALPKNWILSNSLDKNPLVSLDINDDNIVEIRPVTVKKNEYRKVRITFDDTIERKILVAYLKGYEVVEISLSNNQLSYAISRIEKLTKKLVGLEIVEEDVNKIVLQCFIRDDYDIYRIIKQMDLISRSMYTDAINALYSKNKNLALSVIERDNRIDRLYFLLVRLIRSQIINPKNGVSERLLLMDLRLIIRNIEQIGDFAEDIARNLLKLFQEDIPKSYCALLKKISHEIQEFQRSVINLLIAHKMSCVHSECLLVNKIREELESLVTNTLNKKLPLNTIRIVEDFKGIVNEIFDIVDLIA